MPPTVDDVNPATADLPDTVIYMLAVLALLAIGWFCLKALARRDHLVALYERLDPTVQAGRAWVARAPAVFTYMAVWTSTTVVAQGEPAALADLTATLSSTNIANLVQEPVRVFFTSAVLVADHGVGFPLYVLVYVLVVSRVEHRVGSARWLVIAATSHGLGSILTVRLERFGIHHGLLPESIVVTQDIGISYVMVGSLGAFLWLVSRRWRLAYVSALALGILGPLVVLHTIWDLGHFLATAVGTATGWIVMRWPMRPPLVWRDLVRRSSPRALPTFDLTGASRALVR